MPWGSVLDIQRTVGLLGQPGVELFTRPRSRDDLELGLSARDPAVATEGQRRAFDAAGQPSLLKVVVEPPQTVDVDRTVVDPDHLAPAGGAGRPLEVKDCLVDQIEYVAHFPRVPFLVTRLRCQVRQLR